MNEESKSVGTEIRSLSEVRKGHSGGGDLSAFTSVNGFELAQRMAKGLMTATLIPKRYQESIGDTMIAINMAQRLNCDPLMIMQNLYVVHGTPAWSGQFVIAAINQSGMFKGPLRFVEVGEKDKLTWGFYAEATSRDGHVVKGPTITMQLAKNEGWIAKNPKWANMPEMMLRYRAGSWFGRTECPEILMGFQSREEVVDAIEFDPETGEVIEQDWIPSKPVKFESLKKTVKERPDTIVSEGENDKPVTEPEPERHELPPSNEEQLEAQGWYADGGRKFNVHGELWNAGIHATSSKDGNPIVNSDGHFRVRRGGPLPDAETEQEETQEAPSNGPGYEPEPEFVDDQGTDGNRDWMKGLE